MSAYFANRFLFRLLSPFIYGSAVYVLVLLIFDATRELLANFFGQELLLCILLTGLVLECWRWLTLLLGELLPENFPPVYRIGVQGLVLPVGSTLLCLFILSVYFVWLVGYNSFSSYSTEFFAFSGIFGVTSLLYNMVFFSLLFLHQRNDALLVKEERLLEMAETNLEDLYGQVNPAFLYTSLETLIALAHHQAEEADDFIGELAAIYRYKLSHQHREPGPLGEELRAVQQLLAVLNARRQGQIVLNLPSASEIAKVWVVPGTLLALLECLSENQLRSPFQPLVLNLYLSEEDSEYLLLSFKDNPRLYPAASLHSCLDTVQKSYTVYTDRPLVFLRAYANGLVKIPLLPMMTEENTEIHSSEPTN